MTDHTLALFWLVFIVLLYPFLLKSRIASTDRARLFLSLSFSTLTGAAALNWMRMFENYPRWFLPDVYPIIEWGAVALLAVGMVTLLQSLTLSGAASADDSSEEKLTPAPARNSVDESAALRTLNQFRASLAQPYPFVELCDLALGRFLSLLNFERGALYVYNEHTAQMTLVTSSNLTGDELAKIERLRASSELLAEALETGEVVMSHSVSVGPEETNRIATGVTLTTPFVRQGVVLGCGILFSEKAVELNDGQLMTLRAMSEALTEKYQLTRLRGELRRVRRDSETRAEEESLWRLRLKCAIDAAGETDYRALCLALEGSADADAVACFSGGDSDGSIVIHGATADFPALSDGFTSALVQALGRGSATLLSSATDSALNPGKKETIALVAPLLLGSGVDSSEREQSRWLLLWNRAGELQLDTERWERLQLILQLVGQSLAAPRSDSQAAVEAEGQRALEMIQSALVGLAQPEALNSSVEVAACLMTALENELPEGAVALLLESESRGGLRPIAARGVALESVAELVALPGEGSLGRAAALAAPALHRGEETLRRLCDEYDMMNRDIFGEAFSRFGAIEAEALLPIRVDGPLRYLLAVYLPDESQAERLYGALSLMTTLFSLALTAHELELERVLLRQNAGALSADARLRDVAALVNALNNDLLAIIGNCQLAQSDPNLTGSVERALRVIQERAESAAARFRPDALGKSRAADESSGLSGAERSLSEELRELADRSFVGGQILLSEGKACEVSLELEEDFSADLSVEESATLIRTLTGRFSALTAEEEVITFVSYYEGPYSYLDVSRHRRNFSPVKRVASFAHYQAPDDEFFGLPAELSARLRASGVRVALDSDSAEPAYLSLRTARQIAAEVTTPSAESTDLSASAKNSAAADSGEDQTTKGRGRVLAIDDQTMILELLQAMCQSLGYEIDVYSSPREALENFVAGKYDIILSDIAMPELNGWEVAARIRELDVSAHLIFITGWGEGIDQSRLRNAGVDQILFKPFRLEQLTEALEQAATRRVSL